MIDLVKTSLTPEEELEIDQILCSWEEDSHESVVGLREEIHLASVYRPL